MVMELYFLFYDWFKFSHAQSHKGNIVEENISPAKVMAELTTLSIDSAIHQNKRYEIASDVHEYIKMISLKI